MSIIISFMPFGREWIRTDTHGRGIECQNHRLNAHHHFCTYKSNALANPWAVVIKLLDAVVADGAVWWSWRAVPEAGLAKLQLHCEAIHDDVLCPTKPHPRGAPHTPLHRWRGGEVSFISFRRRSSCVSWHYSRVSGRCHEQEEQVLQFFGQYLTGCSFSVAHGVYLQLEF
jgi:hypothetical protein